MRKRDHLGDVWLDEMIILKFILRKHIFGDMDWTQLAQDGVEGRPLMNNVMKLRFL